MARPIEAVDCYDVDHPGCNRPPNCPTCGGNESGRFLGRMGKLRWFRCEACGMDFNRQTGEVKRGPADLD
jgi:transposase-like protein